MTVKAKVEAPLAGTDVGLLEFAVMAATATLSEVGVTTTGADIVPEF